MKRIVTALMCAILVISFNACGIDSAPTRENAEEAYADFLADLENTEVVAVNARVIILDNGEKALAADIKNNTANQEAVSEMKLIFAAWDVEGKPIALKTAENPDNPCNTLKGSVNDTSISGGESWIADRGLILQEECRHIAYVTAIVYTCKIGEALWENPNYAAWQKTYSEQALESWMLENMVNYLDGDTSSEEAALHASEETQAKMTFVDFYENLLFVDFVAINATANLQEDGRNALMTNIRNASRSKISEITVAFAIWNETGEPLLIKCASGQSEDAYVKEVSMGELVISGGKIWDADMGLIVENPRESISHVEAIVVSCTFKDSQWNNPLYDTWYTYFAGKQLDDTMLTTLASFAQTIR